jgi:ureidoglycolate lyase
MRELNPKPISHDTFRKYGDFQSIANPEGGFDPGSVDQFIPDILSITLGSSSLSFSVLKIRRRPAVLKKIEYHARYGEAIFPFDGDIIGIFAPPSRQNEGIPLDLAEAFIIPRATLVYLRPGVWHLSPFVHNSEECTLLCMLPERTYANDAVVVDIPEKDWLTIL